MVSPSVSFIPSVATMSFFGRSSTGSLLAAIAVQSASDMITRGAGPRNNLQLTTDLDNLGLDRSEGVGLLHMRFYGTTIAKHLPAALEIYADDVKCTHGSTTGPVDEHQVFYLQSRGVGLDAARHLLTYAFLAEVTGRIGVEPVRQRLEALMAARHGLPRDLRIA